VTDVVVRKAKTEGFRIRMDIILKNLDKPCIKEMLFHKFRSAVLLPCIAMVGSNPGLEDQPMIFLMNNCSVQLHDDTSNELTAHRVKFVTLPLHTTNIFQYLEFSLSGAFKNRMNFRPPFQNDNCTTEFIGTFFTT
jgi:hypothetical protein